MRATDSRLVPAAWYSDMCPRELLATQLPSLTNARSDTASTTSAKMFSCWRLTHSGPSECATTVSAGLTVSRAYSAYSKNEEQEELYDSWTGGRRGSKRPSRPAAAAMQSFADDEDEVYSEDQVAFAVRRQLAPLLTLPPPCALY